jgi:twinkle protein
MTADITVIKRALAGRAPEVAEHLLPRGILDGGREWCVGSIAGEPGRSLKVCVRGPKAGTWADFAASGESGDLIDLWGLVRHLSLVQTLDETRAWLGMPAPRFEKRERSSYRRPASPKCAVPRSAVLEYLTDQRKLSTASIGAYGVGEDDRTIVFRSVLPSGELAFVKYLAIDRTAEGKKKIRVEPDCEPILFGWQAIDSEAREVALTEGEIDAMTAFDYGFPALSVPFGGGTGAKQKWIECEYERLVQFEVIYLALDMDAEGDAAAELIASRLGRHRCRRVRLPKKDLNECRAAGIPADEIRQCFESARPLDPPELVRAGPFADDVIDLFWPNPERPEQAGYRLPFHKVGDRLRFRPGELVEWTGASGAGKSQILSHALVAMAQQGARVCIAPLEMPPAQLIRRMVKQAGNVERPTEQFIRDIVSWLDDWLWIFGVVGKTAIARILEVFEYARCRYGCDVFAIDSLMRLGVSSEDYEGQEQAVFEIVNWAVEKSVHFHLVAHARKSDRATGHGVPEIEDVKGTSEIGSNAATIVAIWRNRRLEDELRIATEAAETGDANARAKLDELIAKPPVVVNVAKQRNGDWEGKFGLWFNASTYQYRSARDNRLGHRFLPPLDIGPRTP